MRREILPLAAVPVAFCLLSGLCPARAEARPEWSAGLETAACATGRALGAASAAWCNALRADVLFLRQRSSDFGIGASLRLGTAGFDDLRLDPSLSLIMPLSNALSLGLETGPHLLNGKELGISASVFVGLRPFNHYGHYSTNAGLMLLAEQSLGRDQPSALWLALRLDGSWLALPFILAYQAVQP